MRVFCDTNVLVSAFTTRGLGADIFPLAASEHKFITSEVVIEELRRVLSEKFKMPQQEVLDAEKFLRRFHVEPTPDSAPEVEIRDPDDRWILAAALNSDADVLVTGDRDLLELQESITDTVIINPRGFWELAKQGRPHDAN